MFTNIRRTKYCALRIVNAGTGYSEAAIVSRKSGEIMTNAMGISWNIIHTAPLRFAADRKLNKEPMKRFLMTHKIKLAERSVRGHNKMGIIERKNRTVKLILDRFQHDNPWIQTPCSWSGEHFYLIYSLETVFYQPSSSFTVIVLQPSDQG